MPNRERTGYRDLIFSQFHRLIPWLKMIDVDLLQVCKRCSKPTLLAEVTRQTPVKPTTILRIVGQDLGVQSVLINFYTRAPDQSFDTVHAQFLRQIYELEGQIRVLSRRKTELVNQMYSYCADTFDANRAYGAGIKFAGIQKVAPERSDYQTFDNMIDIKQAFERYRYCSPECDALDTRRPDILSVIDKPPYSTAEPIRRVAKRIQPVLFDE